jgi:hypothetical protein
MSFKQSICFLKFGSLGATGFSEEISLEKLEGMGLSEVVIKPDNRQEIAKTIRTTY